MIIYIWTLAATFGALISAWVTVDAYLDLRSLGEDGNGRRILALGWVRRAAIRFLIQVIWAFIGAVAWSAGQANGEVNPVALLLVGTNVALALNTILDARERILLRRIIG